MVWPTMALVALGVTVNVNVTSGGAFGPGHAGTVIASVNSIGPAAPPSIVTVVVNDWSLAGPSRVVVADAQP